MIGIDQIKQLRQETGVSISECKKALEETGGNLEEAKNKLKEWGRELANKKSDRDASEGVIDAYIHPNKRVGVLLELNCETDFVAKSDDFQELAHELCLQIASMNPEKDSLISQEWVKDNSRTIGDLINEYIAKIGENISVKDFTRYEI